MHEMTWQGAAYKLRATDEHLITAGCFEWCAKWSDCPVEVINDIQSIYLQTIPTLCFQKYRGRPDIVSTTCRLCKEGVENVQHLLSACGFFAPYYYLRRHNKVLRHICFRLLSKKGMIDKCPPWYSDTEIKPRYENEDVCLLWDIPEFTGRDGEDVNDNEVLRPDGRLMLKKEKVMYVLEMSVPWIQNRETKFKDKEDKYKDLLINMRGLYKDYKIEQVTFIIDVLGGYSQSFIDSLK